MNPQICLQDFSFSYNPNKPKDYQLKNLNLKINKGEVVVLIGKSGCGKSSLTRVINGLIPFFYQGSVEGKVFLEDKQIEELKSWQIAKLTGNVFQDPRSQFFANEVAGEIAFGCENHGFTHKKIVERVHRAAGQMEIKNILEQNIHMLSYGIRQKVAIASAQTIDPQIYVMDEPSANLDLKATQTLTQVIKKLKDMGKTIIIAEHRLYYLKNLADRYLYIQDGKITQTFKPAQLHKLTQSQLKKMSLRSPDLTTLKTVIKNSHNKRPVVLEIRDLSKKIKGKPILQNINFQCRQTDVLAIIGPNGAGKSTLGKILAGLQKSYGEIYVNSKKIHTKKRLHYVWYIPQDLDSQLFGESVLDELLTGLKVNAELKTKAEDILKKLNLYDYADRHPMTLSGGQKQRLALAVALMYNAPVIVLDEPTSGLDAENMLKVSFLLKEIAAQGNVIIIISHDTEFILNSAKHVIHLQEGKITDDFFDFSATVLLTKMEAKK